MKDPQDVIAHYLAGYTAGMKRRDREPATPTERRAADDIIQALRKHGYAIALTPTQQPKEDTMQIRHERWCPAAGACECNLAPVLAEVRRLRAQLDRLAKAAADALEGKPLSDSGVDLDALTDDAENRRDDDVLALIAEVRSWRHHYGRRGA